ncbi:DNA topoisomerase-3 [Pilibacter termitis]|uniref:DNA topoisomerase n=1 Tax=Pilibacter termitis TaxID=263852 RepID=A0A1T4KHE4_9ENTE|nr:DNA topoisomerase-3 [Pilibacter termitis]
MTKKLIIAEKPSVARDLARILNAKTKTKNYFEGEKYIVTWALGHLLTLKMPEDIEKSWAEWNMNQLPMLPKKLGIKPLPKTTAQLKAIGNLAKRKDVTGAVIATDAGREGELVARWILEWVRFNKPVERLWISSQTDKAVKEGFRTLKPSKQYDSLYHSALSRSKADWLVGLNVTRALTVKYSDNLSAGRVQTPTLAFVRNQEEKIEKFMPTTFFTIELLAFGQKGKLETKNPHQFKERKNAEEFVGRLNGKIGHVANVEKKEKSQSAPLPYDLTELQRVANNHYGFSAKRTLSLVQSLYETHKIVSYPRTDSKYLPRDIASSMKERLEAIAGSFDVAKRYIKAGSVVKQTAVFNDNKVSDHYALIPTEERVRAEKLSSDEWKIYKLIVERFLGLFAEKHITETMRAKVEFDGATFVFTSNLVKQAGWRGNDEVSDKQLDWSKIESVKGEFSIEKNLTSPPKALTEGTLLEKMEKSGLGTPATRAEIIEKLISSELMERGNGTSILKTTPKGKQLLTLVNPSLVTPELTAKWEKELELIAKGKMKSAEFLNEIEEVTTKLVREIKQSEKSYKDFAITNKKCPDCSSPLRERNTRDGKFYVCTSCSYRRRKDAKISNHRCPTCHKKMEIIEGSNGAYFRCKYDGTTEKMLDKSERKKKMSKHEERKLLKKINQESEPEESPLALALKKAMAGE